MQKHAKIFLTGFSQSIKIPKDIYSELKEKGKNIITIVPPESKKATFFFTDAEQMLVAKLKLKENSLDDKFFLSLRDTISNLKMTNLYSSGICFKQENCYWEGVFEIDGSIFNLKNDIDALHDKFSNITNVAEAEIKPIHLQN